MKKNRILKPGWLLLTFLIALSLLSAPAFAASSKLAAKWITTNKQTCKLQVEEGQSFGIDQYLASTQTEGTGDAAYFIPITGKWRSSNKKVATVNKKTGLVKAKKAGKTKISIKYKGKTYSCTLTVKKKGKLIKGKYLKLYNKYKAMKKYARTKVTASNFSKIKKAFTAYETLLSKYCKDFEPGSGLVTIGKKKKILYVDFEYLTVASNLSEFAWSALENSLVITDVKVNSAKKLTATLKKPVTALQSDILSFCGNTHYEANEFQFYGWDGLKRETYPLTIDLVCNIKKGASKLVFTPSAENADSLKDAMMLVVFHEYGAFTLDNEEEDFYFFRPAE